MDEYEFEDQCLNCGYPYELHSDEKSLCPEVEYGRVVGFYQHKTFLQKPHSLNLDIKSKECPCGIFRQDCEYHKT